MRTHHARIIPEIALESMSAAYHWSPRLGGGKGGVYFGVGGLALAVGGALGNGSGVR